MSCKRKKKEMFKTFAEAVNQRDYENQPIEFCGECWGFHLSKQKRNAP